MTGRWTRHKLSESHKIIKRSIMCKTINSLAKNKKRIALFNTLFLKDAEAFILDVMHKKKVEIIDFLDFRYVFPCPIIRCPSLNNTASGVEIRKKDGEEHIYVSYLPDDEDEGDWLCDILLPSDAFDIASLVNDICQAYYVIPQD